MDCWKEGDHISTHTTTMNPTCIPESSLTRVASNLRRLLSIMMMASVAACANRIGDTSAPVPVVPNVDLQRYMGAWYIVGAIGLALEDGAHNAIESYALNPDGTIATVFQFRKGSFDGEVQTKVTRAWVEPGTGNAEWRVRTIWPLRQQYVISHLEPDYSAAIVARDARDYVWILSRDPEISEQRYQAYRSRIAAMGYDMSKFSRYPQNGDRPI